MGLDSVELIMAFEEEFDIQISDEEASRLLTPRQVAELVAKKFKISNLSYEKYLLHKKFNIFRKFLIHEIGIERQKIRPNALISDLLQNNLTQQWKKISRFISNGKISPLKCSKKLKTAIQCCVWFFAIISAEILAIYFSYKINPYLLIAYLIIIIVLTQFFEKKFATEIPEHLNTVGKIATYLDLSIHTKNDPINIELNFDNILLRVIKITHEQLLIPIDQIKPDSCFIDDLNMDQ
ncbi:MAG: hypothetical protein ACRCXK_02175 [Wohlfahrtiimonas sp.]